jgi:hypothetical protein
VDGSPETSAWMSAPEVVSSPPILGKLIGITGEDDAVRLHFVHTRGRAPALLCAPSCTHSGCLLSSLRRARSTGCRTNSPPLATTARSCSPPGSAGITAACAARCSVLGMSVVSRACAALLSFND